MGKTHMVEFAFGGTGQNAHHGSPYNPWDASAHRSPGGSSSGAGVSLCEGSALLAFGSDTAASVRLPAAMTGNAGLKFTKDRWSSEGIVPLSFSFDTPGILARSMADAGFSFAALDPKLDDGFAFLRRVPTGVDGIRIGIADSWFWDGCENGIDEIVRSAIVSLARAGAVVKKNPCSKHGKLSRSLLKVGCRRSSCVPSSIASCRTGLRRSIPLMRRRSRMPRICRRVNI
jgi:aspartyl-tRNA(Asn)/glutamyl-tRNA(Gln) amidotransferase subunit A